MKNKYLFCFLLFFLGSSTFARNAVTFHVGGDADKFYPVAFGDVNWDNNRETLMELGRSDVHTDNSWMGSLISKFRYHITNYGHGSNFIHAEIHSTVNFIAGWKDASSFGGRYIIIWLKGGGCTYYLNSDNVISPVVYDGVQNALPLQETNGPAQTFKTQPDEYIGSYASIQYLNAYYTAAGNNYFNGNVGIGTFKPKEKLSVNGKIRAHEIMVETANWPDYVFEKAYQLPTLKEIERHIQEKGHLPGIPSAKEVKANGIGLGEMNAKLLQKIEELTLHLIDKDKQLDEVKAINSDYGKRLRDLESKINLLLVK